MGGGAITVSPMPGPHVASSNAAESRTVRLRQCSTASPLSSRSGPSVMRPWLGLSPTRPQHDAGMRIDPPPSLAWANGTIPDATAAAAPPLDPPGVRVVSHGLRVAPHATGSVVGTLPSSGLFVRPAITSPAARWRLTSVVSASAMTCASLNATLPLLIRCPAYVAARSLMRNGTPRNRPLGSSALAAVSRAWSNHRITTALRAGSMRSMRSIAASSSSLGDTSPDATSAA